MSGARYTERSHIREHHRAIGRREIIKYIILIFVLCILSVMQTSFAKLFGNPIGLTLLFVSALGMLFGERDGAIFGLVGGVLIDSLSGGIIYTSPLVYMLIGYFCGICSKRFLSKNLPSYIVYMLIVGLIKQAVNLFYFVMLTDNFNLMQIFIEVLVPDYISFIIFSPVIYGLSYLLFKLIYIKKKKKF